MGLSRDREEFAYIMGREAPECYTVEPLRKIMRLAQSHQRLMVAQCNGEIETDGEYTRKRDALQVRIRLLVGELRCQAIFSGDPRGATVKILVPSGYSNSWGGEGVCVPAYA